jgi:tetratricopeptide (TPR) repeat protein
MRDAAAERTWVLSAPLPRLSHPPGAASLPGTCVLEECSDPYGALLWRSLRSVHLWSQTPPTERAQLFAEGAGQRRRTELSALRLPEPLRSPLGTLAQLLDEAHRIEAPLVAAACEQISLWAGRERPETALEFAQAAALACPNDARLSWSTGVLARDRGRAELAEAWLMRAVVLSRRRGDWMHYGMAHLALAKLRIMRGNFPAARRHLRWALGRARRHHLHLLRARVLHAQLVVETESGDPAAVERCAAEALEAYRDAPDELSVLAFDVAYFWMDRGHFAEASAVFAELAGSLDPRAGPHLAGARARCAGALGEDAAFDRARAALEAYPAGPGVAPAWANVASGALGLQRWSDAHEAARRASALARKRGEHKVAFLTESLAEQATAGAYRRGPSRPASASTLAAPQDPDAARERRALARRFTLALGSAPSASG